MFAQQTRVTTGSHPFLHVGNDGGENETADV